MHKKCLDLRYIISDFYKAYINSLATGGLLTMNGNGVSALTQYTFFIKVDIDELDRVAME